MRRFSLGAVAAFFIPHIHTENQGSTAFPRVQALAEALVVHDLTIIEEAEEIEQLGIIRKNVRCS